MSMSKCAHLALRNVSFSEMKWMIPLVGSQPDSRILWFTISPELADGSV